MKTIIISIFMAMMAIAAQAQQKSFYDFTVKTIDGEDISLSTFKGKKVLVVNVASKCGFTPQYAKLEELYEKYGKDNFVIIGFPANNFLSQEPGSNEEIKEFCTLNYGVTFPMMAKISVKGKDIAPLYKWLTQKSENGVHRLVRVSPFDANARRQTSFASLEVMPELDNTIQVDIRPEDIEMQVYRSSGAGGQHINKTSSAVRLIHKPTGIVVSCQTQRSQFQNRDYAMEMLKAKLYQIAKQQHMDKIDDIKGVQNEIAWGHQIRSYVFMPYTMVKDHRTNYETGNVDAVMDGDLDGFIFAYLKAASRGELQDT